MKLLLGLTATAIVLLPGLVPPASAQDDPPINLANEMFNSPVSSSAARVLKWLADGGDPNIVIDSDANTLVHHAATNFLHILRAVIDMEALLQGGADPRLPNARGNLAYDYADKDSEGSLLLFKAGGYIDDITGVCVRDQADAQMYTGTFRSGLRTVGMMAIGVPRRTGLRGR